MNKEWVETAMRLARELADPGWHPVATNEKLFALEAHLNTPNTDQVDSAKHQSTAAATAYLPDAMTFAGQHSMAITSEWARGWDECRYFTQTRSDSAEAEKQNLPKET